jgi:hypothetical protein
MQFAHAVGHTHDVSRRSCHAGETLADCVDRLCFSTGLVWYASFGEQILGHLDPRTGTVAEYSVPVLKPSAPKGILGMRFDEDENPWLALQFQGGIAKFDRATKTFQTWSLPPHLNGDHVQINQVSPGRHKVDGKVWLQDAGTYTVLRLDVSRGTFEVFEPYKIPRPNVYDVVPDTQNNGYVLPLGSDEVGRIDAKTGEITMFKTPTRESGPRRGMMDANGRLWFWLLPRRGRAGAAEFFGLLGSMLVVRDFRVLAMMDGGDVRRSGTRDRVRCAIDRWPLPRRRDSPLDVQWRRQSCATAALHGHGEAHPSRRPPIALVAPTRVYPRHGELTWAARMVTVSGSAKLTSTEGQPARAGFDSAGTISNVFQAARISPRGECSFVPRSRWPISCAMTRPRTADKAQPHDRASWLPRLGTLDERYSRT